MTVQCLLALLFQAVPLLGGPPNLLLMAVDNLGWDDVSWHNPEVIMPNLATLATSGVILDSSYVQPDSSSSQASLLTGTYASR